VGEAPPVVVLRYIGKNVLEFSRGRFFMVVFFVVVLAQGAVSTE
jgi:hypothetical protein